MDGPEHFSSCGTTSKAGMSSWSFVVYCMSVLAESFFNLWPKAFFISCAGTSRAGMSCCSFVLSTVSSMSVVTMNVLLSLLSGLRSLLPSSQLARASTPPLLMLLGALLVLNSSIYIYIFGRSICVSSKIFLLLFLLAGLSYVVLPSASFLDPHLRPAFVLPLQRH